MSWLEHPSYKPVRDQLIERFRTGAFIVSPLHRIAFVCGGAGSDRRAQIESFLKKRRPDTLAFRAEDVWNELQKRTGNSRSNALEIEERLAKLADIVIIVVESPGTFAELGAFSLSENLRRKLLPILDATRARDDSFINTGPVRWIDADSDFAPSIRADFSVILSSATELGKRLDKIPRFRRATIARPSDEPKFVWFVLWDIVAAVGPAPLGHVRFFAEHIIGAEVGPEVEFLLGLGLALGVISAVTSESGEHFYYRRPENGLLPASFTKARARPFDLSVERARVLSAMQRIAPAQRAMALMEAANASRSDF